MVSITVYQNNVWLEVDSANCTRLVPGNGGYVSQKRLISTQGMYVMLNILYMDGIKIYTITYQFLLILGIPESSPKGKIAKRSW